MSTPRPQEDDYSDPDRIAVSKELDYMQMAALQSQMPDGSQGGGSIYALLRDRKMRPSLKITVICAVAQQFSGKRAHERGQSAEDLRSQRAYVCAHWLLPAICSRRLAERL